MARAPRSYQPPWLDERDGRYRQHHTPQSYNNSYYHDADTTGFYDCRDRHGYCDPDSYNVHHSNRYGDRYKDRHNNRYGNRYNDRRYNSRYVRK